MPQLGQTPKFSDYVTTYLEAITKKDGTVEKEESTLDLWKEHIGHLRLDKIKPVHVASFVQKRLKAGMSKRTAELDVIALRNVLKRSLEIEQHIKTLPIPPGLNSSLKSTPPKRPLFESSAVEGLCTAALAKNEDGCASHEERATACDYVRFLAYSGARRNEALRIQWQDVNFDLVQVTIGADGDTKNSTGRVVDFNPKLAALLTDMKRRNRDVSKWLFPSPQRGAMDIHAKTFKESLNQSRTRAELPGIAFHDCATILSVTP